MAYKKFDPDKAVLREACIKHYGNATLVAKEMRVARCTINEYFKRDPEGKKIIDEVRSYNDVNDIDLAEFVNRHNMMNYVNRPALAQRAAERVLELKGRQRGWGVDDAVKDSPNQSELDKDNREFELQAENIKLRKKIEKLERSIKKD